MSHQNQLFQPNNATTLAPALGVKPDMSVIWRKFDRDPITLDAAAGAIRRAHAADGDRDDVEIPDLRAWGVIPAGEHLALAAIPFPGVRQRDPLLLRATAFRQLCGRMGAPPDYLLGLPAKLQLACANYGMSRLGDRAGLVRLAGNEARAIVSDRYAKLDDEVVLEALYESLGRLGLQSSIRVRAVATGGMTALRMTFPTEAQAILPSDPIEYGLDISNGELGARSVGITSSTYRLVCTNGMRAWRSDANLRLRHVGSPNKLREAFLDGIPVALAESRGQMAQWARSVERMVENVFDEIDGLRQYGLSASDSRAIATTYAAENGLRLPAKGSAEDIGTLLQQTGEPTVYNVANAITKTAQFSDSPERRFELEEAAHRYLTRRVGQPIVA
jgi:hypothetical protein